MTEPGTPFREIRERPNTKFLFLWNSVTLDPLIVKFEIRLFEGEIVKLKTVEWSLGWDCQVSTKMDILKDLQQNTQACKVRTSSNDKTYKLINEIFRKAATLRVYMNPIHSCSVTQIRIK